MRIRLSKNLIRKEKKIFVKYFDDIIKSKNTFDLLMYLKKKNKKNKLFFIMGADNLINFHKWQNWKKIFNKITVVIFRRHGYNSVALKSITSKTFENYQIKSKKNKYLHVCQKHIKVQ